MYLTEKTKIIQQNRLQVSQSLLWPKNLAAQLPPPAHTSSCGPKTMLQTGAPL